MTPQQVATLDFIRAYQAANGGVSPSYSEIMPAIGVNSVSGVHRIIGELKERGRIETLPRQARSITILDAPSRSEMERWSTEELTRARDTALAIMVSRLAGAEISTGRAA